MLCWYKIYSICLVLFTSLYKLFQGFTCANNTGRLVNSSLRVQVFNHFLFYLIITLYLRFFTFLTHSLSSYTSSVKLRIIFGVHVTSSGIWKIIVFIKIYLSAHYITLKLYSHIHCFFFFFVCVFFSRSNLIKFSRLFKNSTKYV